MSWNFVNRIRREELCNRIYFVSLLITLVYYMICLHYKHLYINLFMVIYSIFETQIICSVFILASPYYLIMFSSWNLYQSENLYYGLGEDILIVNNILTQYFNVLPTGGMCRRIILKWMWNKQCCVAWAEFMSPRIGTSGKLLWTW
jgi:hypothetical protein